LISNRNNLYICEKIKHMAYERKTVDILISEELRDILLEIESESIVAYKLLRKRHKKEDIVDNNINYISVSKTDKTRISYMSSDRLEIVPSEEYWTSSKRYNTKPGSFVSKVFKNISQVEIEKFSNLFKSESVKPRFKFEVVSGDEIKRYYKYDSYAEDGRGSLGISCMKHDSCQKLLDIYTNNTEVVSMVVMLDEEGYLLGRAILWNFDGNKIMDRIYTQDDEKLQHHFKKWATSNNYLYKSEQNWYNTLFFENMKTEKKELRLEIKIDADLEYLPYMDTFKFIGFNGYLYNYQPDFRFKTLCSCEGSRYDHNYLRYDSIDKVFRYRGEATYLEYLSIYTHERNVVFSSINDCYILKEHSKYDDFINEYIFNDEYDSYNKKDMIVERIKYIEASIFHFKSVIKKELI
jgi:hypothetical protein